jgi:hypothetical protein
MERNGIIMLMPAEMTKLPIHKNNNTFFQFSFGSMSFGLLAPEYHQRYHESLKNVYRRKNE